MKRRTPLLIAVIWLITVAGAATLTWTVIAAAGTQVGQIPRVDAAVTPSAQATTSTTAPPNATPGPPQILTPAPRTTTASASDSGSQTKPTQSYVGSWSGKPGKAIARCTGTAVSLVSAIPNDGYRVKTERESTKELVIEFEGSEEDTDENEVHLLVSCANGRPVFRNH